MPKMIDLTGQKIENFTVLERDYQMQQQKNSKEIFWKCQCNCGKIFSTRGHDIRQGKIKSCGCLKKEQTRKINAKDLTNQTFGLLTVLYKCDYLIDNHYVWHCKCACGNEKNIMGKHLTSGATQSCGCLKSQGENRILQILNNLNIRFEYQKKFTDCKITDKLLVFDFFLPDYNLIIEYNGIQHYQPIAYFGGEIRFKQQQKYDLFKKEWSEKNGLKLITISYKELSQLNEKFIKNLIKGD